MGFEVKAKTALEGRKSARYQGGRGGVYVNEWWDQFVWRFCGVRYDVLKNLRMRAGVKSAEVEEI